MCPLTTLMMAEMRISKLEPSKHKEGRWLVWLEDGTLLRVGEENVADFGLYAGMELSGETLEALTSAAALSQMKNKALNILSARSLSRRELIQKLTARSWRKQEEDDEADETADPLPLAEETADWLERIGLLNDLEYAKNVVRHCQARGYGERRARDELYRHGVPRDLWDEALDEERTDPDEAIDRFLAQKLRNWTGDRKELKRATDALARRGFPWEDISAGLRRLEAEMGEE